MWLCGGDMIVFLACVVCCYCLLANWSQLIHPGPLIGTDMTYHFSVDVPLRI